MKLYSLPTILDINEDVYEMFGELSAELRRRGEAISDFDKLIASIALTHEASIVSTDSHFSQVPGLTVISP